MADYRNLKMATGAGTHTGEIDIGLRAHMNKVYGLMSGGLFLTFLAAWSVGSMTVSDMATQYALGQGKYLTDLGATLYLSPLKWVLMFLPLGMVFLFGAMINRISAAGAQTFFFVFAVAMGVSISWIFVAFTGTSIAQVFLITSIAFAGLSLWGYTTKRDLSGWGSFLIMGVIGLIAASIVNIWMQSDALGWAVSVIGLLVFSGLTAYDTQRIKTEYVSHATHGDQEWLDKSAIMGSLSLYINFINIFMFLLQFLGGRE